MRAPWATRRVTSDAPCRSARASAIATSPRASSSTLKSSPISAGDSSFWTAAAARRYSTLSGAPTSRSRSRMPQPSRNDACVANPATRNPRALAGVRDRREIDVARQVGQSRPEERIGMHAMAVMADERSGAALRVVVLVPRKSVVDDEQRARRDAPRERRDERLGGGIHLARVVAFGGKARFRHCAARARRRADARPTRARRPRNVTPRSSHAPPRRATTRGAIASSTSFITTTPSMASRAAGRAIRRARRAAVRARRDRRLLLARAAPDSLRGSR